MPKLKLPLSGADVERPKPVRISEDALATMKNTLTLQGQGIDNQGKDVLLYTSSGEAFLAEPGPGNSLKGKPCHGKINSIF